jgi:aquaporin Z
MQPPESQTARFATPGGALAAHWPEYLMEAAELGIFMVSACLFTVLLFHPSSPAISAIPNEFLRRLLTGLAMGATAIALIYSPLGARSGAHFNPSVTLTFLRMGRIAGWDAFFYICAQFIGSVVGVALSSLLLGTRLAHPATNFAVTVPGMSGLKTAARAEFLIAFILMTVVLNVASRDKIARFTGIAAGMLVATFIAFEAPFSGMSMNPARTFGSAFNAHVWTGIWIYFVVPPLAMLSAAELFLTLRERTGCAKLNHAEGVRCIFCEYQDWKTNRYKLQALATAS